MVNSKSVPFSNAITPSILFLSLSLSHTQRPTLITHTQSLLLSPSHFHSSLLRSLPHFLSLSISLSFLSPFIYLGSPTLFSVFSFPFFHILFFSVSFPVFSLPLSLPALYLAPILPSKYKKNILYIYSSWISNDKRDINITISRTTSSLSRCFIIFSMTVIYHIGKQLEKQETQFLLRQSMDHVEMCRRNI